jgi:hypothetical protein
MTNSYFNIKYFERQITCHKNGCLINDDHARNVKRFWDRRPKDLPAGVGENLSRQVRPQDEELVGRVAIGRGWHSHEVNSVFVHRHCYEKFQYLLYKYPELKSKDFKPQEKKERKRERKKE